MLKDLKTDFNFVTATSKLKLITAQGDKWKGGWGKLWVALWSIDSLAT